MPINEQTESNGNSVKRTITTTGVGSSNINCSEEYHNTGVAKVYSDQGNFEVYQKDMHFGCNGNSINQTNGDSCLVVGGRNEQRFEGSNYKIVGDADTYFYHPVEMLDKLNAEVIAYRSGFNDDRNDIDPSKLIPSFGMNLSDITNSVSNQTNNNIKYPAKPEKTGGFLYDHLAAIAWDADCAIARTIGNTKEQLYQMTVGKVDLLYTKITSLADDDIDNLNCDEKTKETLKNAKEGDPEALLSLPGESLNILMAKLGHDSKNKENFNKDAYYQSFLKDAEQRNKLLNLT